MKIYVANKKGKMENIRKKYPDASIFDITSSSEYDILRVLSPFYPHKNIPIPGMPGRTATCAEAVWQGLKVFENYGVDYATFHNDTMQDIKRSVRKYGKPLGHKYGDQIINYSDARWLIYIPTYLYMLENVPTVQHTLTKIKERLEEKDVVLLDYNTNCNVADYSKPLSHAGLVKLYLEGNYPRIENRAIIEAKFCATKQNKLYNGTLEELLLDITKHPKYEEKKHIDLIRKIELMDQLDLKKIAALGGKGRSNWREIIKDIQKPNVNEQLSLF